MLVVKRMVCLANSRKLSGRCIAGKEPPGGLPSAWIRPVSARESHEVSEYERQYPDGSDPCLLDIMKVPLLEARPTGYQQENWLLDSGHSWQRVGRASWTDLQQLVDPVEALWIDGHSTHGGCNDKVPLGRLPSFGARCASSASISWFSPSSIPEEPSEPRNGAYKRGSGITMKPTGFG